jgi:hypothetical protein
MLRGDRLQVFGVSASRSRTPCQWALGRCIVVELHVRFCCRAVSQRSPQGGLAIYQGVIVLGLNKRFLGAAGALVAAVSLAVTGSTAASAGSTRVSGTESIQIMSTSATSTTQSIIVHGVFTDYGVDHSGNTVDTIVLQKGSFKVAHSAGTGPQQFNPKTCLATIDQHGTYKVSHGTGKYRGIHGSGTYHISLLFIGARVSGKCSQTAPPVAFQQIITASGPVSLP